MTPSEIILTVLLYSVFAVIVGLKQYRIAEKMNFGAPDFVGALGGIFWPIFLGVYILRTAFFRDWT